jgi:hypothetical protein
MKGTEAAGGALVVKATGAPLRTAAGFVAVGTSFAADADALAVWVGPDGAAAPSRYLAAAAGGALVYVLGRRLGRRARVRAPRRGARLHRRLGRERRGASDGRPRRGLPRRRRRRRGAHRVRRPQAGRALLRGRERRRRQVPPLPRGAGHVFAGTSELRFDAGGACRVLAGAAWRRGLLAAEPFDAECPWLYGPNGDCRRDAVGACEACCAPCGWRFGFLDEIIFESNAFSTISATRESSAAVRASVSPPTRASRSRAAAPRRWRSWPPATACSPPTARGASSSTTPRSSGSATRPRPRPSSSSRQSRARRCAPRPTTSSLHSPTRPARTPARAPTSGPRARSCPRKRSRPRTASGSPARTGRHRARRRARASRSPSTPACSTPRALSGSIVVDGVAASVHSSSSADATFAALGVSIPAGCQARRRAAAPAAAERLQRIAGAAVIGAIHGPGGARAAPLSQRSSLEAARAGAGVAPGPLSRIPRSSNA